MAFISHQIGARKLISEDPISHLPINIHPKFLHLLLKMAFITHQNNVRKLVSENLILHLPIIIHPKCTNNYPSQMSTSIVRQDRRMAFINRQSVGLVLENW